MSKDNKSISYISTKIAVENANFGYNHLQDNNYFYEWLYDNLLCLDFELCLDNYCMLHIYSANHH
jgi:hypothetical protein